MKLLECIFVDCVPAVEVAKKFGYTYRGFTTLVTWFRNGRKNDDSDIFFLDKKPGRKRPEIIASAENLIIQLRLTNHSVPEIKTILDSGGERRTTLRGLENIRKRYLIATACYNLSLLMRTIFGIGTPKQAYALSFLTLLVVFKVLFSPLNHKIYLFENISRRIDKKMIFFKIDTRFLVFSCM